MYVIEADIRLKSVCPILSLITSVNYVGDTKISVSIKKLMPTNAH